MLRKRVGKGVSNRKLPLSLSLLDSRIAAVDSRGGGQTVSQQSRHRHHDNKIYAEQIDVWWQ